jgi:demethylmenaquinone methyltransferase / 2-methoxy-6-polyprenyl-1,4-benzoquinol methylase
MFKKSVLWFILIIMLKKTIDTNLNKSKNNTTVLGSGKMFDVISSRYDFINKVMSFGFDQTWRNEMVNLLNVKKNSVVLDLATGTGDVAINIAFKLIDLKKKEEDNNLKIGQIIGIDTSEGMINVGNKKIEKIFGEGKLNNIISLQKGDAQNIKYPANNFDIVTMAFGIRNIPNRKAVLKEIHRVIKKNTGRIGILELNSPSFFLAKYFIHDIIPVIGYFLSGGFWNEYKHLENSIFKFPTQDKFILELKNENFDVLETKKFMFGTVSLYILKAI